MILSLRLSMPLLVLIFNISKNKSTTLYLVLHLRRIRGPYPITILNASRISLKKPKQLFNKHEITIYIYIYCIDTQSAKILKLVTSHGKAHAMYRHKKRQKGAASIEFVFVFVIFFMLFYGMVTLSFSLLLSATYEELSAEALREVIKLRTYQTDTSPQDGTPSFEEIAQGAVNSVIQNSWLPNDWAQHCESYSDEYSGHFLQINGPIWSVCISHNNPSSILPKISLFGFDIANLPNEIHGEAMISF